MVAKWWHCHRRTLDLAYSFIPPVFYHATIPLTTHISVI
nr:MAG TPA: hypothetical protein [Caudoviricetes sp.]